MEFTTELSECQEQYICLNLRNVCKTHPRQHPASIKPKITISNGHLRIKNPLRTYLEKFSSNEYSFCWQQLVLLHYGVKFEPNEFSIAFRDDWLLRSLWQIERSLSSQFNFVVFFTFVYCILRAEINCNWFGLQSFLRCSCPWIIWRHISWRCGRCSRSVGRCGKASRTPALFPLIKVWSNRWRNENSHRESGPSPSCMPRRNSSSRTHWHGWTSRRPT